MKKKVLKALKRSIKKWEKKAEQTIDELDFGPESCPLCELFHPSINDKILWGSACIECPIYEKTNEKYCNKTPYKATADIWDEWDIQKHLSKKQEVKLREGIQEEIEFLKGLLPNESQ